MGIGDLVNSGLGEIEDGFEAGKKLLGEGVDKGSDLLGKTLDKAGAHDWAEAVEYVGDNLASDLGATPGEKQLGESDLVIDLIHGSVSAIRAGAKHLTDFHTAFDKVGQGMRKLDSSEWKGEAADAFREKFAMHPTKWLHAADACDKAAKALDAYADTVTWAQEQAREALRLYKKGKEASDQAVSAYNKRVDAYNAAIKENKDPGPHPDPFKDPGTADIKRAHEILDEARRQRNDAGRTAADSVHAALAYAPAEPPPLDRLKADAVDGLGVATTELTHVAGGVVKGSAGLVDFVRGLDPLDPYNLTHPAAYFQNVSMTLSGLVSTAAHPDRALNSAWEGFKKDPAEGIGRMLPEALGTKGLGLAGGGLRGAVREGAEAAGTTGLRQGAREAAEEGAESAARRPGEKICERDPVDVATGRMVLPQTDVSLPARLPLVVKRSFESSYRLGGWFGPRWSSTLDQRLEIDAEGVVFVGENGLLLSYPHPAPGLPTLPVHGPRWSLDREADGYTVTDPELGLVLRFVRRDDSLAVLEQIDDRNGNWITFEYGVDGAPRSIAHSGGYRLKITTEEGRVTALALAGAAADGTDRELLRYGYTDGHLTQVVNSTGQPMRFGYDERGRITSWTDSNDSSFTYAYDDEDRCTRQSGAAGHQRSTFAYGPVDPATGHSTTTITDSLGHSTRYIVNDRCQVVAEANQLGAVTRYQQDRYNRPLSVTDPLGHTTSLRYDEWGNLIAVVRPDGREARAEYNHLGLPVKVVRPDGTVWRQTYDDRGNRTSVTDPAGRTTHFTYDEAGHLTAQTDPQGHTTTIRCNRAGLPVAITDPVGATTRYERDAFGRPVAIADPLCAVTRLEWTVEGHLARRTAPDGTTESWSYDGEGNCTSHTDSMDGVSRFEYTHFDLLRARTGPDGVRYEFEHDTELRLTKVINPQGLTWSYEYDAAGCLLAETDFDDRTLTYTHDPAGRLTSRRNALGQVVTFERNELGQLTRRDAAGRVTTFAYDLTDQLAQATGPDGTTLTVLRDRYGRVRSESVDGRELTYGYDELGRRTSRTTPTGATTTWSYDPAGRRTGMTVSGRTIDFTYDPAGREVARRIGGGAVTLEQAFDALGRLTAQSVLGPDNRPVQHRTYTYRADGNLIGIDDRLSGSRRFDLDAAGRVTAVHASNWAERYAYDEAGNQTAASWPADHPGQEAVGERTYVGTRITRAGNVRYEHDALGRVTLRQKPRLSRKPDTWRYEWDAEDRLTSVTTPDGTRWSYTYDPLGRRTAKIRLAADGETVVERVDFTWDGTTLCEQTTTSPDLPHPVMLTWDHEGLRPIAQTERITAATEAPQEEIDSRFFAIVTDLVGTPSELIDEQGEVAWRCRSTLWGTTAWAANSTTYTPLRFPGQYYDPETGLYYNYFRHYNSETARYFSADPLGLGPAPNPVSYVHNPHAWMDPLGLGPCPPRVKDGGWDLRGRNPLGVIPHDAEMRQLKPDPNGGAQKGVEYKWKDPETGNTVRLRVHDRDGTAPAGSYAANGDVYRISIGGRYQDEAGNLYHRNVHNPNSPHYNPDAANATHIPWPSQYPLPY
ncbi:putative T7SS-secreted protein [Streptomyces sp. NPDC046197]|uniref:putative T7SS-secreted protein n=1 Tax=Streptomyces sp. NPDC046197 TaxID=3154337 RepID=UPI003408E523